MKMTRRLLAAAPLALIASDAFAQAAHTTAGSAEEQEAPREIFASGVAKGCEVFDAAITTGALSAAQVEQLGANSVAEIVRNIPGVRVEAASGVINFFSKTGDLEGGEIQATVGVDQENYRLDFDYGGRISPTLRYHAGGGRTDIPRYGIDVNDVISATESRAVVIPLTTPGRFDSDYDYVSHAEEVNCRISELQAVFARSGHAAADRIVFCSAVDTVSGGLTYPSDGFDIVKLAEEGMNYRQANLTLNLTGFRAETDERNAQINAWPDGTIQVERLFRAFGLEAVGAFRRGPFSMTASATYTKEWIVDDVFNPAVIGNTSRHQPDLIFQVTPQVETERFTIGANSVGPTETFAQNSNQPRLHATTLVNGFAQVRLNEQLELALVGNNLFNKLALTDDTQEAIPASGLLAARALSGRTVTASLHHSF